MTMPLHIETRVKAYHCPLLKLQESIKMREYLDWKFLALSGTSSEESLFKTTLGYGGDPRHRPEQIDQRRDVVRPHVENRSAAGLVEKFRTRMPALGTRC